MNPAEMDVESQVNTAFRNLVINVETKTANRDSWKETLRNLKKEIGEQSSELLRLQETHEQLRTHCKQKLSEKEKKIAEERLLLETTEKKLPYWSQLSDILRGIFRVKLKCSDSDDPTKVSFAFLLSTKEGNDCPVRSLVLTENPTAEQVDAAWMALQKVVQKEELELEGKKKKFKEKCLENLETTGPSKNVEKDAASEDELFLICM